MSRDYTYEENNIGFDEQYTEEDGGGIKCKNYIICGCVLPNWWYNYKGCYNCTNCLIAGFGDLKITEQLECPICFEVSICVIQPQCTHHVCISCFKRCHFNHNNPEGEPIFPYPDVEDEYFDDMSTHNTK
jgi:hypothetical protein